MSDSKGKYSEDANAFNQLISLETPLSPIRWEVFGTPEYDDGVPGPTDYLTLIAEVQPIRDEIFKGLPTGKSVWIAPESARNWLNPKFQRFLTGSKNTSIDMTEVSDCRVLTGLAKKTSRPVTGMVCRGENSMLLYVTIANYT